MNKPDSKMVKEETHLARMGIVLLVTEPGGAILVFVADNINIILVRHGLTEFNQEGRMQGGVDSPLTPAGILDARRLGRYWARRRERFDRWYVSPLGRTRQTSGILREEMSAAPAGETGKVELPEEIFDERIREISCGRYDGRLREELAPELLKKIWTRADFPYPGGESARDVMERGREFLKDLLDWSAKTPGEVNILLVSHGNFCRCMGAVLGGFGDGFALNADLGNTGVCRFHLRYENHPFAMSAWNDTSHLIQEAAF